MRYSQYLLPTLKEVPAEAELISHQLMLRAGMIRKVAAGIYTYMPYGLRAIRKVERIVREEMDRAGAQELLMPMVTPAELWQETGRWQAYGRELLRLQDRKEAEFCLGPTHEEVITDLVRREIHSYRQLPVNLYQIQTKFRDEIRPRFGLMRGREFIMKDAYSFDVDEASAAASYERMEQAYRRIFARCGLDFRAVEADTGSIGGSFSHEFMVLAQSGEDAIVSCSSCDYAANVEKAELPVPAAAVAGEQVPPPQEVATPDCKTIEQLSQYLQLPTSQTLKSLVLQVDDKELVMVLLRGDHTFNETKFQRASGCRSVQMATDEQIQAATGSAVGYLGPVASGLTIWADHSVATLTGGVCGAGREGYHLQHVVPGRDFQVQQYADLRQAQEGDACPRCGELMRQWRGIEVGHVFRLGEKYSQAMGATVQNEQGQEVMLTMGCYGIGIGRTVAAAIEQNHDANGMILPPAIAPFHVIVTVLNPKDAEVRQAAEDLWQQLEAVGLEVLFDDRDERPGSKFKDADLLGIPWRVTVGAKGLKQGAFELQERRSQQMQSLPPAQLVQQLHQQLQTALQDPAHRGD